MARAFGPQGVGGNGIEALGVQWFAFALFVFVLTGLRTVYFAIEGISTKRVHMNKGQTNCTNHSLFRVSLIDTMWAIGTSVAAGALSA
jgi:hypothetical protein